MFVDYLKSGVFLILLLSILFMCGKAVADFMKYAYWNERRLGHYLATLFTLAGVVYAALFQVFTAGLWILFLTAWVLGWVFRVWMHKNDSSADMRRYAGRVIGYFGLLYFDYQIGERWLHAEAEYHRQQGFRNRPARVNWRGRPAPPSVEIAVIMLQNFLEGQKRKEATVWLRRAADGELSPDRRSKRVRG